jgi:hypothetical protein
MSCAQKVTRDCADCCVTGMVNLLRFGPFHAVVTAVSPPLSATGSPPIVRAYSQSPNPAGGLRKYLVPNQSDAPEVPLHHALGAIPELSFMSQLTCRLFENREMPLDHDDRVSVPRSLVYR